MAEYPEEPPLFNASCRRYPPPAMAPAATTPIPVQNHHCLVIGLLSPPFFGGATISAVPVSPSSSSVAKMEESSP